MLAPICMTTKLSSCARKLGSSALTTRSGIASTSHPSHTSAGSSLVAWASSRSSASCSDAIASSSGPLGSRGADSNSAQRSSTSAAACLTALTRGLGV